ncbi:hypothetical protein PV04_09030 [Phialophora macrospora]|uniref:D-xylose 1-dehydrogenase (NADP(+), D-xylono-1,5-lactone-forming) n=1 Tax=Phialophora macrospora TaxID=1851006 RepID=A0A0D2DPD7_9EURO|nr:hypothetical protein PV04_09030 [Phialophora macrospora]
MWWFGAPVARLKPWRAPPLSPSRVRDRISIPWYITHVGGRLQRRELRACIETIKRETRSNPVAGTMAEPKVIRWGIIATGYIAKTFSNDLLVDPRSRGVTDIKHAIVAVASSSSIANAEKFIAEVVGPQQDKQTTPCTAYGSYEALVKDDAVDLIYIATPHSHHYQVCMLCLEHGKAVLCEKPLVVNAKQVQCLQDMASKHKAFLMEALWTRLLPVSEAVRKYLVDEAVGEVLRVSADLSIGMAPEVFDVSHRMVNLDLAGGALLDLGIYNLSWIFFVLYNLRPVSERVAPRVMGSAMTLDARTGADEATTVVLEFPPPPATTGAASQKHHAAHAIMSTAFRVDSSADPSDKAAPTVRIQGTQGELLLYGPIYNPGRLRLVRKGADPVEQSFPATPGIQGMIYEADEAASCWLKGQLESNVIPWAESLAICEVMDEVRRRSNLKYPDQIETTVYGAAN